MHVPHNPYHASACYRGVLLILLLLAPSPYIAFASPVQSMLEIREERVVIQAWDLSCGAATLATVLRYQHNDPVTEKEVASALIRRPEYLRNPALLQWREGFSLLDLKRFVDGRGYTGVGLGRLTLGDLEERAPAIVPLRLHGYNHFVVFRGSYRNQVLIADPAWGNRTLSVDAFERAWIDFPGLGKVGFVVLKLDGKPLPNRLAPKPTDFLMIDP